MAIYSYYVDSAAGSDATGDGSSGNPWATIDHCMSNRAASLLDDIFYIYLNGSWDYSASSITVGANNGTNFCWIANPTAEIILDAGSTRNLFASNVGYMNFKGIKFSDVWWTQINCGSYCSFDNCHFVGRSGTNAYTISGGFLSVNNCLFEGAGTGLGLSSSSYIRGCRFIQKTGRTISTAILMQHHLTADRCRFEGFDTPIIATNYYGATISHCNFKDATTAIMLTRGYQTSIYGNVFEDCTTLFSVSNALGTIKKNASYGHTTIISDSSKVADYEAPTVLSGAPFADPANDDWTPSAELAALEYVNQTYGAFAADGGGGGGGGYYNPFTNPVFGAS